MYVHSRHLKTTRGDGEKISTGFLHRRRYDINRQIDMNKRALADTPMKEPLLKICTGRGSGALLAAGQKI
jgi:hypothetical protein